ncbi:HEXXH motif domain-containing protein [Streptomyces antibioticus]|uniref:HEXXH motif domain-containing protein n=1 Tax=Streptomyces antibioticus TaxID=1890 RepID=UPI0004CBE89D
MRTPSHALAPETLAALLGGGGGSTAVEELRAGERSWRLLVVRAVLDVAPAGRAGPLPPPGDGWRLLTRAWTADARAAERVLAYPAVGVWAAHTLRRLRGSATDEAPLWVHTGHLHALAASAAVLAGIAFRTDVPVRDGWVVLPLVGALRLPEEGGGHGWGVAEVAGDGAGRVTVAGRDVPGPGWHTPTALRADGCALLLDDLDPYRALRGPAAPEPLGSADDWRELFAGAWRVLRETGAEEADALARGLSVVVPRPRTERFRPHSASSGNAFGAALASVPDDAEQFASTLVHEFQHNKLSALMHLFTLHDDPGTRLHYAPWRDDPRPLGGLLQGVYAFHGVTGFWRRREHPLGRFEFALWRAQTAYALRALAGDGGLTDLGRRLVAELTERLTPWLSEPVDPRVRAAADLAARDHRATWRAYHLRPDPRTADADAGSLERGTSPPALVPGRPTRGLDTRAVLLRRLLADPEGLTGLDDDPGAVVEGARPEDVALVTGRTAEALEAFRDRIVRGDGDPESWTGLALAAHATGDPAGEALLAAPERALALYARLGNQGSDPLELGRRLG